MRRTADDAAARSIMRSRNPCGEIPIVPTPFQSTTRRGLAADGTSFMGPYRPGTLVSQGRYVDPQGASNLDRTTVEACYETRLGLLVGIHGIGMEDQVDVVWSAWAPTTEPTVLAARRRARQAARARGASERPVEVQ